MRRLIITSPLPWPTKASLARRRQIFERALRIDPNFAEAPTALGRVLVARGKPNEAMTHYETALRLLKSQRENSLKEMTLDFLASILRACNSRSVLC